MRARRIVEGVYWVGVNDPDRKLFEELTPLPEGTSYNCYFVQGEDKCALIDTVDNEFFPILEARLKSLGVEKIDYVISNHSEQDHSGALPIVLDKYPEAELVCTPKGEKMLQDLMDLPAERIRTVEDRETIDLGGRTLEFIHAPWVHWPETMLTYLREDEILFPCDMFGSHQATNDLYMVDEWRTCASAKRYFAEVMMPFHAPVRRNMEKIAGLPVRVIAPSHGPLFDRPEWIMDAYHDWAGTEPKNLVVLPYVSMHGSTRKMVLYLMEELLARDVRVEFFNMADVDEGRVSMALVDAATVVFGSSNVLNGMHPKIVYVAYLANAIRPPKLRYATIVGSYGWSVKMDDQLKALLPNLKAEILDPVITRGHPKAEDFESLTILADVIAEKHRELGLIP